MQMKNEPDRLFSMDKVLKNINRKNLFDFLFKDFDKEKSPNKQFEVDKKIDDESTEFKSLVDAEPKTVILKPQEMEYSFKMQPRSEKFNDILINLIKSINNIDTINTIR